MSASAGGTGSSAAENDRKLLRINPREGLFHAMLSYRVTPDQDFICKLHNKVNILGARGSVSDVPWPREFKRDDNTLSSKVRVFQDFYCLKDGKEWEGAGGLDSGGFVGALCQSVIFVPLFSAHLKSTPMPTPAPIPTPSVPSAKSDLHAPPHAPDASVTEIPESSSGVASAPVPQAAAVTATLPISAAASSNPPGASRPPTPDYLGSIGLMKHLNEKDDGKNDKQDNVLLELIIAMELNKYAVKNAHISSSKSMFPCSVIFPLFQSKEVWDVTNNSLSTKPHVVTNQKALDVLKKIGENFHIEPSVELANGTLSPKEVVQFYSNFQGMKLFDYGAEVHQIDAAAKRLLECIEDAFSNYSFDLFDANYTEVYELRKFLTSVNLSHFYPAMVAHKISSVEQFASLAHNSDGVVAKLAADACRISRDSDSSEVVKLQAAIRTAQKSPLARPLEDRFINYVDVDAAFLTAAFSSSAVDILLGKRIVQILCVLIGPSVIIYAASTRFQESGGSNAMGFFPQSLELNLFYNAFVMFEMLLVTLAGIAARVKSPRIGRFIFVAVLILFALFFCVTLAVSVTDAVATGCRFYCGKAVSDNISVTSKVAVQAVFFSGIALFAVCFAYTMAMRQDLVFYTGLIGYLIYWYVFNLITTYIATGNVSWGSLNALFCGLLLVGLPLLRKIGLRRADEIFSQNSSHLNEIWHKSFGKLQDESSTADSNSNASVSSSSFCSEANESSTEMTSMLKKSDYDTHPKSSLSVITSDDAFMKLCAASGAADIHSSSNTLLGAVWETQTHKIEPSLLRQNHPTFTALLQDSEFVNVAFQEWVSSWLKGGPSREDVSKYFCDDDGESSASSDADGDSKEEAEKGKKEKGKRKNHYSNFQKLYDDGESSASSDADGDSKEEAEKGKKEKGKRKGQVCGEYIRGPIKHVDRAISKAYRSYFGNFQRLTDIVRCCVVLNSIEDIQKFVKKIVANSWIRQTKPTKDELVVIINQGIYSSSTKHLPFMERCEVLARQLLKRIQIDILGLTPLHSAHQCYPSNEKTGHAFELLRVRNRFGDPRPIGGYRDINLKLRIGFMGDIKSANPLFCPVHKWSNADVKFLVVEIQVQLKASLHAVRQCCESKGREFAHKLHQGPQFKIAVIETSSNINPEPGNA